MEDDTFDHLMEETHAHKTHLFDELSNNEPKYMLKPSKAICLEQ